MLQDELGDTLRCDPEAVFDTQVAVAAAIAALERSGVRRQRRADDAVMAAQLKWRRERQQRLLSGGNMRDGQHDKYWEDAKQMELLKSQLREKDKELSKLHVVQELQEWENVVGGDFPPLFTPKFSQVYVVSPQSHQREFLQVNACVSSSPPSACG